MHDFTYFQSDRFYDIWTQQRRSVRSWKLVEQNFENFTIRVRFSRKMQKCLQNFKVLRLQATIPPQQLQIAGNSLPNWPTMGCLVTIFSIWINLVFPLGCTFSTRKVPNHIFGNVQCPILRIKTNTAHWCQCLAIHMEEKQTELETEKINAADNADITQSQARDTGIIECRK